MHLGFPSLENEIYIFSSTDCKFASGTLHYQQFFFNAVHEIPCDS